MVNEPIATCGAVVRERAINNTWKQLEIMARDALHALTERQRDRERERESLVSRRCLCCQLSLSGGNGTGLAGLVNITRKSKLLGLKTGAQ